MIFPWQKNEWQLLLNAKQQNRLPHSLLFTGREGIGKKQFALEWAKLLLCHNQNCCENCHACHLVAANSHPDLIIIEPETQIIKIDQIRAAIDTANETAQQGGYKIFIINPANAMNSNAANALLKTLEEPSPQNLFILISTQQSRLPATISSRCQKIFFNKPERSLALAWLEQELPDKNSNPELLLNLAAGSPLKALALFQNNELALRETLFQGLFALSQRKADPLKLAAEIQEADLITIFNWLFSWNRDLLRYHFTKNKLLNSDYLSIFSELATRISQINILHFQDHLQKIYSKLLHSFNLNRQLVMEEIFILWTRYAAR